MPHPKDLGLVRRVIAADREAFDALFVRLFGRVLAYARRRVGDDGRARSVVEATLREVFEALPSYDGTEPIEARAFVIARRRTAEVAGKAGPRPSPLGHAALAPAEDARP